MSEHELEKLLGGFAADTLTQEERQKLFAAALHDQQLFNALADEQALKELLADPAVRRRLRQALSQASPSPAGGLPSWLDWCRRPAGVAFTGGLAAAVFAVVLGTKIYQDSLKQATQSVATEDAKPIAPPASAPAATRPAPPASQPGPPQRTEPEMKASKDVAPPIDLAKKDTSIDKKAKRERSAPSQRQEYAVPDTTRENVPKRSQQEKELRQTGGPIAALGKTSEEVATSADQKPAGSAPAPATAPEAEGLQMLTERPVAGILRGQKSPIQQHPPAASAQNPVIALLQANPRSAGARALYYAEAQSDPDLVANLLREAQTKEKARLNASADHKTRRSEPSTEATPAPLQTTPAVDKAGPNNVLGLRFEFIGKDTAGNTLKTDKWWTRELDRQSPLTLSLEANQPGYLIVWTHSASKGITVLFPQSLKDLAAAAIPARTRQLIQVPSPGSGDGLVRRVIYFSRSKPPSFDDEALRRMPYTSDDDILVDRARYLDLGKDTDMAIYLVTPAMSPATSLIVGW